MQYSLNGKTWTDIAEGSTSISGLGAGKVYLRKKADATHKASEAITVTINSINPSKATFYTLFLHTSKVTKKGMTLTWSKVDGAAKYVIYGGRYGAAARKLGETTSTKNVRNTLKSGKIYKFYVVALDAKGNTLCTSATVYAATKGGKFTNYKSVKTSAVGNAVKVAAGGTFNLNAKTVKSDSKLKIKKIQGLKYASTNPSVAKVTKKGVITGVNKGTCYVYVYAQNGVYKKIKVTVE